MTDIIFYTNPQSRGVTVRWMLEECGADYDTHYLTYNGTMKSPDYLKINPMGKVPAIVHKDHVITETAAICTYLADIFPNARLVPENRADYYRWLFFMFGPFEQAIMDKMMKFDVAPEMEKPLGYGTLGHVVQTLETWLKGRKYIAGDKFSAADCIAVAMLSFAKARGGMKSEIFDAYCEPHLQRPAFIKASALDDAAFKEMSA